MTRSSMLKVKRLAKDVISLINKVDEENNLKDYFVGGTKKTGALRRASMELTRALTEMRRP